MKLCDRSVKSIWLYVVIITTFAILFIRHAWIGDDAYITLRTVANLVEGYGPRWNIAERVQTFTHPLWMLILSAIYLPIRDHYFVVVWMSFIASVMTLILVLRQTIARDCQWTLGFVVLSLLGSKAFMDYTSSGLENPLSYLLIVIFIIYHINSAATSPRGFFAGCFLASLLILNRMDLLLFVAPVLIQEAIRLHRYHSVRKVLTWLGMGLSPLIAWCCFSIVYYGFLFPNTYYAKLNTGIPKFALWQQGLAYYLDSIGRDPVTILSIGFCILGGLVPMRTRALTCGVVLYLIYLIDIGGDFMSGRFLSVPLVASIAIFASSASSLSRRRSFPILCGILVLLVVSNKKSTFATNAEYQVPVVPPNGVADERGWYYQQTGLLRWTTSSAFPNHFWRQQGEQWEAQKVDIIEYSNVGMTGFFAGPTVHIVDNNALTDPLLSRIPIVGASEPGWRIGHFHRDSPPEYIASLRSKENLFVDPKMRNLYADLQLITRGSLWSLERWNAILRRNF